MGHESLVGSRRAAILLDLDLFGCEEPLHGKAQAALVNLANALGFSRHNGWSAVGCRSTVADVTPLVDQSDEQLHEKVIVSIIGINLFGGFGRVVDT